MSGAGESLIAALDLLRDSEEKDVFSRAGSDPVAREQVMIRCYDLIEDYLRLDALAGRV